MENTLAREANDLALVLGVLAGSALVTGLAHVPNEASGTISVIDSETDQKVANLSLGDLPWAVSPP